MKKLLSKAKQKFVCKKGGSHFLEIAAAIIIVVLIVSYVIPKVMNTTEEQTDNVDSALEDMWNYSK